MCRILMLSVSSSLGHVLPLLYLLATCSHSDLCNLANSAESLFSFINDHKEQDRSTVYEALLAILLIYENKDSKEWLVESIARNEDLQQVSQIDLHLNYIHSIDP